MGRLQVSKEWSHSLPSACGLKRELSAIPDDMLCLHRFEASGMESPIKHFLLLKDLFKNKCVCMYFCVPECSCLVRPEEGIRLLELELQVNVSHRLASVLVLCVSSKGY